MQSDSKVKIVYRDLEGNIAVETLWCEKVGKFYRIKNIPFFAYNLAYDDLIKVEEEHDELYFDELIQPSGHSTIQIIIFKPAKQKQVYKELVKLGCGWEGSHLPGYISVDVPKTINYIPIKAFLEKCFANKILDYKEACLAHEI